MKVKFTGLKQKNKASKTLASAVTLQKRESYERVHMNRNTSAQHGWAPAAVENHTYIILSSFIVNGTMSEAECNVVQEITYKSVKHTNEHKYFICYEHQGLNRVQEIEKPV